MNGQVLIVHLVHRSLMLLQVTYSELKKKKSHVIQSRICVLKPRGILQLGIQTLPTFLSVLCPDLISWV